MSPMSRMQSGHETGEAMTRQTNFSIAAIMASLATPKTVKEETIEEEEEEVDVGVEDLEKSCGNSVEMLKTAIKQEPRPSRMVVPNSNCSDLKDIKCSMDNKDLWDKFCEFETEMIITRTGRRMFPTIRVSFSGLESLSSEADARYLVLLDIVPCDNKRYRYAYHRSAWLVAGKADPAPPHRLYCHPDGPFSVEQLKKQVISFDKVKITNNETDKSSPPQIILTSMHKFQPRVYLVKRDAGETYPIQNIEKEKYRSFVFPETQFTAVTAYQNQCITKLKIESNPFAKGFRDASSADYDDAPYGIGQPSLPGAMLGGDPFARPRFLCENNNNSNNSSLVEKARLMLMYPGGYGLPPPPPSLPLPSEMIARYSALQATLQTSAIRPPSIYPPALLAAAAALRPTSSSSIYTSPSISSSPTTSTSTSIIPKPHRFSPYIIPKLTSADTARKTSSPSPSPPHNRLSRPVFPIFR